MGRLRSATVALVVAFVAALGCGPRLDREGAKAVADSFMSDIVANRVDDALNKMMPDFLEMFGHAKTVQMLQFVFDQCGRPLGGDFKRDEAGFYLFADGRKKPMRKFYYSAATTTHPKGACYFAVQVVPGDHGGYYVVAFTTGKLNR